MKCSFRIAAWLRFLAVLSGLAVVSYLLLFIESYENQQRNEMVPAPSLMSEAGAPQPMHLILWDRFGTPSVSNNTMDVLLIFTHSHESRTLSNKLRSCLASMQAARTDISTSLRLHLLTDASSLPTARKLLRSFSRNQSKLQVSIYDLERLVEPLRETVAYLQPHFSYKPGAYYSDALFFLSVSIHRVMPLHRILMLDVDTRFTADIFDMWRHFYLFSSKAIIGLAHEQQPVYYHLLREYRLIHPNSTFGAAQVHNGNPGFNSGVLLLDLERMRNSEVYNSYLNATAIERLTQKYQFKGHLGDQDFFTLLSFEHPELFHELPCTWNRQLCQWWRHHGYADVFLDFYKCDGVVNLYHGNCNTPMPTIKPKDILPGRS